MKRKKHVSLRTEWKMMDKESMKKKMKEKKKESKGRNLESQDCLQ